MNLFPLDSDLDICAQYTVDKHVVKIITEANQLLSNCHNKDISPYRHSHINHPMAIWVRQSLRNYFWTVNYCLALNKEYTFRYNREHAGLKIANWFKDNIPEMPDIEPNKMPRCFGLFKGVIPETDNVIIDYRNYYLLAKSHLFNWKNRSKPSWI
jgi:hypothetical protein